MDPAAILPVLPGAAFGFMLVVARVGSALLAGPGLGEAEIPPTVRIALAAAISALVYPVLARALPGVPATVADLLGLLAPEILFGLWMGLVARITVMALGMAGSMTSFMIGLSSVLQLDPSLGTQVPALERMLGLAAVALLLVSGLYLLPLQAIVGSYTLVPPGQPLELGDSALLLTRAAGASFALALRLAAPFVVACMVWQGAMGLISRLVPAIQVHLVSTPAQIAAGLTLLGAAVAAMFDTWSAETLRLLSALPGL